jgi:hypothetical protein
MPVLVNSSAKTKLISQFKNSGRFSSSDIIPFAGSEVGFSVKKNFGKSDGYASLIKFAVMDEVIGDHNRLYAGATYGEDRGDAVAYRSSNEINAFDPVDIESGDEYTFDITSGNLYKNSKVLTGKQLSNEFISKHTKTAKRFKGMWLRFKLRLWRNYALKGIRLVMKLLSDMLYLISGDRYSYDPFLEAFEEESGLSRKAPSPAEDEKKRRLTFLGYSASSWTIVIYCAIHFVLFSIFYLLDWHSSFFATILKNNFLTLTYVVVSLFLLEVAAPGGLRLLIRKSAILLESFQIRKIKV